MKPESPDAGRLLSSKPISPQEAADRLAIRELLEAYSHCADRRDARGQMALFTTDTHLMVYVNAKDLKPLQELPWREALARKHPGQTRAKQNERDRSTVSFCYLSGLLGRPTDDGRSRHGDLLPAASGLALESRRRDCRCVVQLWANKRLIRRSKLGKLQSEAAFV